MSTEQILPKCLPIHGNTMWPSFSGKVIYVGRTISSALILLNLLLKLAAGSVFGANLVTNPGSKVLSGYVPDVLARLTPKGILPATNRLQLAIGLPLRHQDELDELIAQLYDPHSTNYHKFLKPAEFTSRFGPTEQDFRSVVQFAQAHGLTVTHRHGNRVVLDVSGNAADIGRAFQVTLRVYQHPTESRHFFSTDTEPSVPANLPVADIWGLSDYARPRPQLVKAASARSRPLNNNGTGLNNSYQGADFRNAYVPGSGLNGAGQTLALVELDGYYSNDITSYEAQCGYPDVPVQNVLIDNPPDNPGYSGIPNAVTEVSLDIEMSIAMAPGLSKVVVYQGYINPYDIYNAIALDDTAKQVSSSWTFDTGYRMNWAGNRGTTLDSILSEMVAQGQAFFQAAGDDDAYTGNQSLTRNTGPIPVDSPYLTSVGGTSLSMNGTGGSWASETVWNYGSNQGTGGGVSPNYRIPLWQSGVDMSSNGGSSGFRNIPDVALTADAIDVVYSNGMSGIFGGTSCAAPLWAGFCALVNQQAAGSGDAGAGFLNPALYNLGLGTNYAACFHDTTTGNNIGNNIPGLYYATNGYDLCTGWGTPNGTNLINALAPLGTPFMVSQPVGQNVISGTSVVLEAGVNGAPPLGFQWLLNGASLNDGGNISGSASATLSISVATTNNAGNYQLVVGNSYGSITSSVAVLNVGFPPMILASPTNLTLLMGGSGVFAATIGGSTPLVYQWQKNGANLVNDPNFSGVTSNNLSLIEVSSANSGNYDLYVTNIYGAATCAATLLVDSPPTFTSPALVNQTVQCGSNYLTFAVTLSGEPVPSLQWSLDSVPVDGATNLSFSLTNLDLPNHTVSVLAANFYGSVLDSAVITVQDTLPPVITLNGANPLFVELGSTYVDPGASATDLCMGTVPVTVSGSVNANVVGTNTLTYSANDGNGNISTAARTVIVRDTTPPTILHSFTNLVLAAGTNCEAFMPNVTGTNYLVATDLSEPLTITQYPTNDFILPIGTNSVVIAVADAYGNTSYSANTIVVQDQTPPVILSQPQGATNVLGGVTSFGVAATACTPETYQWWLNSSMLVGDTNSTLTFSNLTAAAAGNYAVVVTASGGSTTSLVASLTVNLLPTAGTLSSSENPSGFHDFLNFTAGVTPTNVSGTIQFYTNGAPFDLETLNAGQALSTTLASLPRGTNLIAAVYSGDASDSGFSNVLYQVVTNHPPTALPAFFTRAADAVLIIPVTNLATYWSDVDGDTVSLTSVSISTNGMTLTNNAGVLTYFDPKNVADQFTCTITDGFGGTNYQTVSIVVVFPVIAVAPGNGGGGLTLNLKGAPGQTYVLQTATNLDSPVSWLPVATNTLGTNGVWQFTDPPGGNISKKFYRLEFWP